MTTPPLPGTLAVIGARIRDARRRQRLTVEELARRCALAKGTVSKIENARLIPNLLVLSTIARQLGLTLAELVDGADGPPPRPWHLLRAAERATVDRDDAVGMRYETLLSEPHPAGMVEAYHLTIEPGARRRPVSTDGRQAVLLLDGRLAFQVGEDEIAMTPGDLLTFDGRIPHLPRNTGNRPARMIAIYLLPAENPS